MPRQARIDAPGALRHVICRGIERRKIFRDNQDRRDLIGGGLIRSSGGWQVLKDLRKEGIHFKSDERILGGSDFVKSVLKGQETDSFMGVPLFTYYTFHDSPSSIQLLKYKINILTNPRRFSIQSVKY